MTQIEPCGRFEWERIIRRAELAEPVKYVALVLATYADADGSRVRPGQGVLCAVTGKGERTVRRLLAELLALGLIVVVCRGGGRGRRGHATTYRLTLPADLLDRVELLPPSELRPDRPARTGAGQLSFSEATQTAGQSGDDPVDNSDRPAAQVAAGSNGHAAIDRPLVNTFGAIDRPSGTD